MDVRRHRDPDKFQALTTELYTADPARHTIALTAIARYLYNSHGEPVMLTVHNADHVVAAALRIPPFPLLASGLPAEPALLDAVVTVCQEADPGLPGVTGPRPEAEAFAKAWCARTNTTPHETMAERLYRLGELTPPRVPGSLRTATDADLPLLIDWLTAFEIEAWGYERQPGAVPVMVKRRLTAGDGLLLWEVAGETVSWAGTSTPIGGMSRVGPVYTPPAHRGRGYGSAVTAAASQWALDAGADQVLLVTDLANPTSNSIYQKIGYRPLYDSTELRFRPLPSNP